MGANARALGLGGILLASAVAGCASGEGPALALPEMPKMPDVSSAVASIGETSEPKGSATDLYARIARGAVGCWFGAKGPLKQQYIYHAEADAPSRGGKAEITIHVRDPSQPNPRGPKAYKVKIEPKDEASAVVVTENLKMPEAFATAMTADVDRWSHGDQGCEGAKTTAAGWTQQDAAAQAAPAQKPAAGKTKQAKQKAAAKPEAKP